MRELTWDDFADAAGSVYTVTADEGQIELTLERATEIPSAGRAAGSFRLEFRGPAEPVLQQAIYPFRRGDDLSEIFIVPVSRDSEATRYEAIFN